MSISTENRCRLDAVCPLGRFVFKLGTWERSTGKNVRVKDVRGTDVRGTSELQLLETIAYSSSRYMYMLFQLYFIEKINNKINTVDPKKLKKKKNWKHKNNRESHKLLASLFITWSQVTNACSFTPIATTLRFTVHAQRQKTQKRHRQSGTQLRIDTSCYSIDGSTML